MKSLKQSTINDPREDGKYRSKRLAAPTKSFEQSNITHPADVLFLAGYRRNECAPLPKATAIDHSDGRHYH